MNLDEHLSKAQYRQLLRVAAREGTNYFTFNIPNTVCNDCGHIDKRYLKECPVCHSRNTDYLTRVIGYLKRVSNFSKPRQERGRRTPLQPCCRRDGNRSGRRNRNHPDIMLKYAGYDIVFQEIPDEVTLALNLSGCPNGCPGATVPICNGTRERR